MHTEERTLDINKQANRMGQIKPIILRRGETGQTQIKINITSDNAPYSLTDYTAWMCAYLPDGKFMKRADNVTKSANSVTYTVQSDLTSAVGDVRIFYVELKKGDEILTTDAMPLIVLDDISLSDEVAQEYKSTIDEMLEQVESMIQHANDSNQRIEDAISSANKTNQDIQTAEAQRQANEQARQSAEKERDNAEAIRQANEQTRQSNETARQDAESRRVIAESERISAEQNRVTAENGRVTAENTRVTEQAKNNADQAANNQAAAEMAPHICVTGEYDPSESKPTIPNAREGRIYAVPTGAEGDDRYIEWMYLNGTWEKVGTSSGGQVAYITTDQIDQVANDEAPSGTTLLSLTGLSYVWAKIKEWTSSTFRKAADKIQGVDIADNAITSEKINSLAVTNSKLAADSVTSDKIEDGTIQFNDMNEELQTRITDMESNIEENKSAWDSISSLKTDMFPLYAIRSKSVSLSLSASGYVTQNIAIDSVSKYTAIGVVGYRLNQTDMTMIDLALNGSNIVAIVKNRAATALTCTLQVNILYLRNAI